ncbi:MAG: nitroreductase family protein, partial [Myxococcales bacterium]|nr:nitroreductase family protein [Myxococcales bacterium]
MDTFEAIRTRRAVKHYDPAHKMTDAEVQRLLEAALLAPTSFNIQNWRFVLVTDPKQRERLQAAAWNQSQVTEASLLFVLCADLNSWAKEPERYWRDGPPEVRQMLVPMIGTFYEGRDQVQRDEAMRS